VFPRCAALQKFCFKWTSLQYLRCIENYRLAPIWSLGILLHLLFPPIISASSSLGIGLAAVEEGDDRQRPAALVQGLIDDDWGFKVLYYGRVQEPVTQDTYLLTGTRRFELFGSKSWYGEWGLAILHETSRITRPRDSLLKTATHSSNLGLKFGLGWQLQSKLILGFDWGTALFPAGWGGILLSTSRKQNLSLVVGWTL
jgi:hypothetical protein